MPGTTWVQSKLQGAIEDDGEKAVFKMEGSNLGFEMNAEATKKRDLNLGLLSTIPDDPAKKGTLMKVGFGGRWHKRIAILTQDYLAFALEGSDVMIELIPLNEITNIYFKGEESIMQKFASVVSGPFSSAATAEHVQEVEAESAVDGDAAAEGKGSNGGGINNGDAPDVTSSSKSKARPQRRGSARAPLKISSHGSDSRNVEAYDDRDCFQLTTSQEGFNAGRTYYLRARDSDADEWVKEIKKQRMAMKRRIARQRNILVQIQRLLTKWYRHPWTVTFFAVAIVLNFLSNIAEAEIIPDQEPGSYEEELFKRFEITFVVIFTAELVWQAITLWFWDLFQAPIFWADACVVGISLAAVFAQDLLGGVATLRAIRIIRILRLFQRLESLRIITFSLIKSLPRVGMSVLVMIFVTSIYAVFGVNLFGDRSLYFKYYSSAMSALFQTCTSDSWASGIARTVRNVDEPDDGTEYFHYWLKHDVAIFFCSYYVLMVWVLVQMVVAVILDQFMSMSHLTSLKVEEEKCFKKLGISAISNTNAPLAPLLDKLIHFQHPVDLDEKLSMIFTVIDTQQKGRLSPKDLSNGFSQLRGLGTSDEPGVVHFSHEDFESFSHNYELCDANEGMTLEQFKKAMRRELWKHLQRRMQTSLATADDQMQPIAFALKMMINDLNEYGAPSGAAEKGMVARLDRLEAMVSQVVELVGGKVPAAREKDDLDSMVAEEPLSSRISKRGAARRRGGGEGGAAGPGEVASDRRSSYRARATRRPDALAAPENGDVAGGQGAEAVTEGNRRRRGGGKLPPLAGGDAGDEA